MQKNTQGILKATNCFLYIKEKEGLLSLYFLNCTEHLQFCIILIAHNHIVRKGEGRK